MRWYHEAYLPFLSSLPLGRHAKAGSNLNVPFHLHYPGLVRVGKKAAEIDYNMCWQIVSMPSGHLLPTHDAASIWLLSS